MFAKITKLAAIVTVFAAAACSADAGQEEGYGDKLEPIAFPGHEAAAMLAFLNATTTDLAVLDSDVGLERRAAEHIILHRNGADGVYPSSDDNQFNDLEELDAVRYVGEVALEQIHAWALAHPAQAAELVEGVQFTSEQAAAVIWGVNHASITELDETVGLSRQAADGLVANAPYASISEMGVIAYVGPAALTALRTHAVVWAAEQGAGEGPSHAGTYEGVSFDESTAQIALSIANTATVEQLTGAGMYVAGANAIVGGRPHATLGHVAETSGVGQATMRALHDYAASGDFASE
jgi:DNA uptake protein ComE-like DNA-binding protein